MSAATTTLFIALLGIAPGPGPEADPTSLVARLGSPRFVEREEATRSLQDLGEKALPALRAARESKDPEVRTRVAALVDRIESELIVRPTLVTLHFRDRPIKEVVQALADQSKLSLQLVNEALPKWRETRITLEAAEPVPLWSALERLCEAGHLGYNPNGVINMGHGPRHVVQINDQYGPPAEPGGVAVNGPFRLSLTDLTHTRHRMVNQGGNRPMGGFRPGMGRVQPIRPGAAGANVNDNFNFNMQVMGEPRLLLSMNGPLKVLEAVDDAGNSLLPPQANGNMMVHQMGYFNGWNQGGAQVLPLNGQLSYPQHAGRSIKRLKGVVPLSVATRKSDPLVIPLADAAGKTFTAGESTLVVHDANKPNPNAGQPGSFLDLTIRTEPTAGGPTNSNPQATIQPQTQIEVVDASGKLVNWWQQSFNGRPGEIRIGLVANPQGNVGPPTQLRFYELVRATTEVTFEFHDILLP
ncbi:MAG TPA: hypothetical protein VG406_05820 [Isosphaeraceae bacterium]|jgi:hypothetical protein|nr:hypothetical protein [Isosphaeraceae bacterium]